MWLSWLDCPGSMDEPLAEGYVNPPFGRRREYEVQNKWLAAKDAGLNKVGGLAPAEDVESARSVPAKRDGARWRFQALPPDAGFMTKVTDADTTQAILLATVLREECIGNRLLLSLLSPRFGL